VNWDKDMKDMVLRLWAYCEAKGMMD